MIRYVNNIICISNRRSDIAYINIKVSVVFGCFYMRASIKDLAIMRPPLLKVSVQPIPDKPEE